MSKQLFEEALADVKKVKEIAESNAKQALIEAVTPKIREFIENQLLGGNAFDDESFDDVGTDEVPADAITPPDAEGKVTLDLDALTTDDASPAVAPPQFGEPLPAEDYELSLESLESLAPVLSQTKVGIAKEFASNLNQLGENIGKLMKTSRLVQESPASKRQITQMISQVEDMYGYVQGSVTDAQKKGMYESKLESYFKCLTKLQEQKTMSKNRKKLTEEDVTLKLTGLPDEIDLDSVGVDLITGDEDGEGDEVELDLDGGGEDDGDVDLDLDGGDEGGGDLGDLDLDGGDEVEESTELSDDTVVEIDESMLRREIARMKESAARLSDDTVVEIDESMLRREIARMKKLREEAAPSVAGHGVDAASMDDFGGGAEEGDPWLDGDVTTESDDADLEEGEEELAEVDEVDAGVTVESAKRRLSFEKKLQERSKARGAQLKREAAVAKRRGLNGRVASLKKEYAAVAKRFNESVARSQKISKTLSESRIKADKNVASKQLADKAANNVRAKLAEANLNNVKLTYTNKLLQNESLTRRQKADIIERLDETRTVREAKLVFESLTKTLSRKTVTEGAERTVLGSSSRSTRPASTQTLNEGFEAERWAQLAGIK